MWHNSKSVSLAIDLRSVSLKAKTSSHCWIRIRGTTHKEICGLEFYNRGLVLPEAAAFA